MLDEGWMEVDFLAGISAKIGQRQPNADLKSQFSEFMTEWKTGNEVIDPFKIVVADLSSMLSGVQHWLTGIDVGIRTTVTRRRQDMEREIFAKVEQRVVEEIIPSMESFEKVANEVGEAGVAVHKSYVRRQLHPIVLCSPFLFRTFTKPLGYAGDYEMMNMMLRDPYEGSSAFAKILNYALLNTEPVVDGARIENMRRRLKLGFCIRLLATHVRLVT